MNMEQIVEKIYEHVSWEVKQNKENGVIPSWTIEEIVYSYASDVVNMEMDHDNPETAPLIDSYRKPEDRALYQQLQQLNGKLTYDQYSEYYRLYDGALEDLGKAAGQIVIAKYEFDYENNVSSEVVVESPEMEPLHLAVTINDVAMVRHLLETGHDPDARNAEGNTCLYEILRCDDDEYQQQYIDTMTSLLLEKGATVDALNAKGQTALHLAGMNEHPGAAELLLAAGADVSMKDINGNTPLKLAEDREDSLEQENEFYADTLGECVSGTIYLLYAAEAERIK